MPKVVTPPLSIPRDNKAIPSKGEAPYELCV